MPPTFRRVASCAVIALAPIPATAQDTLQARYDSITLAWQAGEYVGALDRLQRLLQSPSGERFLEPAALLTGELYRVTPIAPNGRAVRVSANGRYAMYELGTGRDVMTHVVSLSGGTVREVARLNGAHAVFSPVGDRLAYLAIPETPEISEARATLDTALRSSPVDQQRLATLRTQIAALQARAARVIVRGIESGDEQTIATPNLQVFTVAFAPDGSALLVSGAGREEMGVSDVYSVSPTTIPTPITTGPGLKTAPVVFGGTLLYRLGQERFAFRSLASGAVREIDGSFPSLAADGSAVTYLTRAGITTQVNVVATSGNAAPTVAARSDRPIANPAISPDGSRVAFQNMLREDWEICVALADGTGDDRLTREIQHDLFPQWISTTQLLAVMGEARHRRSHLYDVRTRERTRLFHNNTVRTVSQEYAWAASADGNTVIIVADRDGDTVSPERAVFFVDLRSRVTRAELVERVRTMLAEERALRARGRRLYAATADGVRAAVREISVDRIYGYEQTLLGFDSKHITQPGNAKAIEYLLATLRSFGLEPEAQWFEPRQGIRTANVVATIRGTVNPDIVYLAGSHFDSVEPGPGADDNTSGTTALLDVARVLARRPQAATIKLIWFTGEEAGLLGSREFARRAVAANEKVAAALNNDMVGYANDQRLDNTIRYSNAGIRDLQHAAAFLFTDLILYDSRYYQSTDAHALFDAFGDVIGGIGSYPILGNPHYHQPHDVLETINHRLVAEVSKTTLATLMRLATGPSKVADLAVAATATGMEAQWTASPERSVKSYTVAFWPTVGGPMRTLTVTQPKATLPKLPAGTEVRVKAVDVAGNEGWDWTRTTVP